MHAVSARISGSGEISFIGGKFKFAKKKNHFSEGQENFHEVKLLYNYVNYMQIKLMTS